jgi:AmpD protein
MWNGMSGPTSSGMVFQELDAPSPNFSAEPPHERLGVCFHHTVLSFAETIEFMRSPASRVSYHLVVAPDGTRARLVAEDRVAWHAGVSTFRGRSHCNAFLLGLAFAGDTYAAPLTGHQVASALEWLGPRWTRLGWSLDWMTDHRHIAPGRKDDLAPPEWERLHKALADRFGGS